MVTLIGNHIDSQMLKSKVGGQNRAIHNSMSKASMQPIDCTLCAKFHRSDASLGRPKKKAIAKSVAVLMVRRSSRKLIRKKA